MYEIDAVIAIKALSIMVIGILVTKGAFYQSAKISSVATPFVCFFSTVFFVWLVSVNIQSRLGVEIGNEYGLYCFVVAIFFSVIGFISGIEARYE